MSFDTKIEKKWLNDAKSLYATIVLPEAYFSERITLAGIEAAKQNIAKVILLTDDDNAFEKYSIEESENLKVININTSDIRPMLQETLVTLRKDKGMTMELADQTLKDAVYFGTMMVELGLADGLVAGAEISTAKTFKPAFQIIKSKDKNTKVSSFFVMIKEVDGEESIYVLSDCGVNIAPDANDLAGFAMQSAETCRNLCYMDPKVAMLCYSTKGSAEGDCALKVREAVKILEDKNVDFDFDGEMQLDAAVVEEVAKLKCPNSKVGGKANVLIFPNLESGNIGYKLMQRFGGYKAIGPIAQGMRKPINDVSRGANVEEIVEAIALTVLQTK
ncbi:MAG: phosphate acetyltransferase [Clostridia bacterium]|nr:phosphate acetyltransferase [Clostridia bacterium]